MRSKRNPKPGEEEADARHRRISGITWQAEACQAGGDIDDATLVGRRLDTLFARQRLIEVASDREVGADALQRRLSGEPVAYITGRKDFFGLTLSVDARVLDPRPDTETLVDWALEVIAPLSAPRVVDLGTGSGAIALALASERPLAQVLATDFSAEALAVATLRALLSFSPDAFRAHLKDFFPLLRLDRE